MHTCFACDRAIDFGLDDADPVSGWPRYVHRTAHDCARARVVSRWEICSLRTIGAPWAVDAPDPLDEVDEPEQGRLAGATASAGVYLTVAGVLG